MFVRHPLERLVSGYRDGKPGKVFKKWRINSTVSTFNEYIDMLIQNRSNFSKFFMRCNPCRIKYGFIGSVDNFDSDIATILRTVGAENAVTIPHRNETGYRQKKSVTVFKSYYL